MKPQQTRSILRWLAALCLSAIGLILPAAVHAENGCPAGYEPWRIPVESMNDCVAIANYGDPPPARPAGHEVWQSRWGVIAAGSSSGGTVVGLASDGRSKAAAEADAIRQCRDQGGTDCVVEIAFHDQCGATVWGQGLGMSARAATPAEAEGLALEMCNRRTTGCKVYYSFCSYPVRIR